ncbi:hypothetical protein SAMN05216474_2247 [Lishizhenia tianjinensis]|uniref:Tissue inhibitor of metalloproteinase n=1 Tax=Lishizhenia tianjinensis TaxID=477690 RepID=A0A1I7AN55_9FLAO|nr:hypothetical protein [Lishizhenia tianjinensis]SFT76324.1 hypothetical protein SAMN05216474_2247 [Lishizhenia tianjinensis]
MKKFIGAFIGLLASIQVIACSCLPIDTLTQKEYEEAADIFIGKAIRVDTLLEQNVIAITFKVKKEIKGAETKEVIVTTPISSAACGLSISKGDVWYIFGSVKNGQLRANMCGRHKDLTKAPCGLFSKEKEAIKYEKIRYKENKASIKKELDLISTMKKG